MLTKSLGRRVALFMLFTFTVWALGVSGISMSLSQFPMVQLAAASEKGGEAKEESMGKSGEKSHKDMSHKAEKKKMKKEKKKMTKSQTKKDSVE